MTKKRVGASLAVAAAFAVWPAMLAAPVASADTLPNGLTIDCSRDSDFHSTCVIGGCPRVNGDYVVDALHVLTEFGGQREYGFKCINGATARYGIDVPGTQNIRVQACRKKDLEGDWCTPYSNYVYTPT